VRDAQELPHARPMLASAAQPDLGWRAPRAAARDMRELRRAHPGTDGARRPRQAAAPPPPPLPRQRGPRCALCRCPRCLHWRAVRARRLAAAPLLPGRSTTARRGQVLRGAPAGAPARGGKACTPGDVSCACAHRTAGLRTELTSYAHEHAASGRVREHVALGGVANAARASSPRHAVPAVPPALRARTS
jgi:hypothetical protein